MARWYDTRVLKVALQIGAAVMISIVAINAILVLISAAAPNWLPRQFMGVDFIADNRARAQAVDSLRQHGDLRDLEPFVAIIGLSSASEGLNLTDLISTLNGGTHILGLTGGGRNMRDVLRYTQPLLDGDAMPALAVFALNPFHLMDTPPASELFLENLSKPETMDELRGYWLLNRRQDVKYAIDAGIDRIRSVLLNAFDVRLKVESPWREVLRLGLTDTTTEAQWQSNVQRYGERGYYEVGNYKRSTVQIEILHELVTEFQERGTRVILIWMPEHSRLRHQIPGAAVAAISKSLSQQFGDRLPDIIDLRSAVQDSGFADISHMNDRGRNLFSPILSETIDRYMLQLDRKNQ